MKSAGAKNIFDCQTADKETRYNYRSVLKEADDLQTVPWEKRKQLFQEITLKLPEEITNKIKEMAAKTHEKDLMLPSMEQFLCWSNGYPAFECPANVFEPEWIDEGLVSVQKIDCQNPVQLNHLPGVVRYAISCLGYLGPKYITAYITSTLLERSRDNPLKVYYPYQLWELRPSYNTSSGFGLRSPDRNNYNEERWEHYWYVPLASRLIRVHAYVNQLKGSLQRTQKEHREWLLFDGRRIVLLPKEWVVSIDMERINIKGCQLLLRKFQEDLRSLELPPEVVDELRVF